MNNSDYLEQAADIDQLDEKILKLITKNANLLLIRKSWATTPVLIWVFIWKRRNFTNR